MKYRVSFGALGGLGEIGLNSYIYNVFTDIESSYLIVDLGMGFNSNHNVSADTYYPDLTFFKDKKEEIVALVITHGHEDHIGAIPYVWDKLKCPIYATSLTADLILEKLKEFKLDKIVDLIVVQPYKPYKIGKVEITWIKVEHSIPDCHLLFIKTPLGNLVHSGDFKVSDPKSAIYQEVEKLKNENIQYLFCDSTNVMEEGESGGEETIVPTLQKLITKPKGACWISAFSSNIERIANICNIAQSLGKKIVLFGRSFKTYSKIAQKYKILDTSVIIPEEDITKYPRNRIIFLVSGSQGEERSVLNNLLIRGNFKHKIQSDDIVIFSSTVIPGNEKKVYRLYNELAKQEIEFFTSYHENIHVSGHPKQNELLHLYSMIKPKWIVPMHGEIMHLKYHSKFAYDNGYPTFNCPSGVIVELFTTEPQIIGEFPIGKVIYEGDRIVPFNEDFVRQRSKMFFEGAVFVTLVIEDNKFYNPIIDTLGLLTIQEEEIYLKQLSNKIIDFSASSLNVKNPNVETIAEDVRILTRRFFKNLLGKKPIVRVHLVA